MREDQDEYNQKLLRELLVTPNLEKAASAGSVYIRARLREGEAHAKWREEFLKINKVSEQ